MKNTMLQKAEKIFGLKPSTILMLPLLAIVELLFIFPSWDVFLAPILALLLCFFYFVDKKRELVAIILIFGNDALGTLVMGSISTVYLVFLFLFWEVINIKKISMRSLVLCCIGAIMALIPSFFGVISAKMAILTIAYIVWLIILHYVDTEQAGFLEKLKFALSCIIFLQSLHLLITGGIVVSETADRAGLIGVGIGDANYSALIICIGVASALTYKKFKWHIKMVCVGVMIAAMVATLSISGLIALIIVIVLSFSIDTKLYKVISRTIIILLIFVLLYQVYISLPDNFHFSGIDDYIARVQEKLDFAAAGDYDSATTDRSYLANYKMNLFVYELPLHRQLFGFNSLMIGNNFISHNTYVDFFLQFGVVGTLISFAYIIWRLISSIGRLKKGEKTSNYVLTLKLLFLFFALTISIYQGPTLAMFFIACFLL